MTWSARRTALVAALPPLTGLDVVDLGCATGELARLLLDRGAASVLALDLDPGRLDLARLALADESAGGIRNDRLRFEQADLEQATLPFEAYDLACCTALLRLVDPVRFGRMVRSGLRQRATLVCAVPADADVGVLAGALERAGLEPVTDAPGIIVATKPPRRAG